MDKVAAQILELFKHLVRDILVYLIGGLLIIANLLMIDYQYFSGSIYIYITTKYEYLPIIIILFSYGLGQIIMGFMYLFIERTGIEKYIKKLLSLKSTSNIEDEIFIFIRNKDAYDFFIERYNHLSYLRWSLAGASLICFLFNAVTLVIYGYNLATLITLVCMVMMFIVLLPLHYQTDHDYNERVKLLNKNIKSIGNQSKAE